jgi:hypothetical protein
MYAHYCCFAAAIEGRNPVRQRRNCATVAAMNYTALLFFSVQHSMADRTFAAL